MRRFIRLTIVVLVASCGRPTPGSATHRELLLHSPELNQIMREMVNQPFSALAYLVLHRGDDTSGDGELDYSRLELPVATLRTGLRRVQTLAAPPVRTEEGRAVFFTYVESMATDAEALQGALEEHDDDEMRRLLARISDTCNDCHHFFRLDAATSENGMGFR
jgi:hypothetical protein